MNFIKRNIKWIIGILVVLLIFLGLGIWFLRLVYPDSHKDLYGDRLKQIDSYKIEDRTITGIKDTIKENSSVLDVSYHASGRILKFQVKTAAETDLGQMKQFLSETLLEKFSDQQKEYYDMQIIIENENAELTAYPAMGYKHRTNEVFSWSNNE